MARKDFYHPFQPYEIQQKFMEALYDCIENGQVGIFESPTGTGKSLSLICGSLTWLREHKRKAFDEAIAAIQIDDDEPDWMLDHAKETRRKELQQVRADFEARLQSIRDREKQIRERSASKGEPPRKKQKRSANDVDLKLKDDEEFLLDDYDSDHDHPTASNNKSYSVESMKLMEQLGMIRDKQRPDEMEAEADELKIFVCSRTHSQLSQFVGELQRVKLPPSLPSSTTETENGKEFEWEELKQISLGSRKNLCINEKVNKLATQTAINERCVELQQSNVSSENKCPYIPKKDSEDLLLDFRDHAFSRIRDIEDLAKLGSRLEVCPYYASRPAIGPAEIVTLPYPLLLQKTAREALGISLKNHVVIIDEAHNILQAIEGIHSNQISEIQLKRARESLIIYLQKFRNKLKGSNRIYVTQVVRVIDSLLSFVSAIPTTDGKGGTMHPADLLRGKGVDQINLRKLIRYISESKLARKVEGYMAFTSQSQTNSMPEQKPSTPTLMQLQNFLTTLLNLSEEGQFFWYRDNNGCVLRYMLLDPSEHFRDLVEDCRAVILAGGTMSPMQDYIQQLFPYLNAVKTFSCGHLIPTSSLLVRTIGVDDHGHLDFTFKSRSNPMTMARVGKALLEIAPYVRGGLVVFFPSYSFLDEITAAWRKTDTFAKLNSTKTIFSDGRSGSAEDTFKAYGQTIKSNPRGAILLSVIGGKLSEGINFSDDLARCVVVVGLPFPNLDTPDWIAKMRYIDEKAAARGEAQGKASREHAENVCMRSVNQAIGRVIRHKDDWASVLLMDHRYTSQPIRNKLPDWIKKSLPEAKDVSISMAEITKDVQSFFSNKI
ncbi:Hypothetical protein R9X50_00341400 [Acrodontium crateriforme]|uniref:ATP-dependent DNA helicase CHL1 n=1 Tax=Acrodontium crateriforme TaxID=150365 RepID=A0AAQ3R7E8_9PEZI|nr:Hypothetical protein R9X50_00341400 [Acrodontium crateriforme]